MTVLQGLSLGAVGCVEAATYYVQSSVPVKEVYLLDGMSVYLWHMYFNVEFKKCTSSPLGLLLATLDCAELTPKPLTEQSLPEQSLSKNVLQSTTFASSYCQIGHSYDNAAHPHPLMKQAMVPLSLQ